MQTLAMGEPLSGKQSGGIDESPLQQAAKQVASSAISEHALTRIKNGLQSPDSSIRLQSVHKLVDVGGGPDLAAAAQEITEAFKLELALQTQSRAIPNGYLPSSAWRRIQYARLLADLPQKAHGVNFAAFKEAKGSLRSWLAISLGDAGDDRVTGVLVRLLHTNRDWPTRWAATEALGAIGSPQAVSALKQVMKNDPAHEKSGSDGTLASTFYPVREQAAGALIRLGQKIRLVAPNTYRVIKTPIGTASGAMDTGGAKQPIEQ
jgi:HEAT repeat protein